MIVDQTWHLAQDKDDKRIAEFELQLWRVYYGFIRWQEECEKNINGTKLTGPELAILHIVRMQDKPKSIVDIGRLLNREDTFNIKYSVQKLVRLGLVEKTKPKQDPKTFYYQITEAGIKNTNNYTAAKRSILSELFKQEPDLNLILAAKTLSRIKFLYDEATCSVSYAKLKKLEDKNQK